MQNTQTYNFIQNSFLLCIILQLCSDGKSHRERERDLCQVFGSCGIPYPWLGRLPRESSVCWSRDLLPPVCLFLGPGKRAMGYMPDGFLCHTLILEVRRPFIYPLGERPGFQDCREASRGVPMLLLSIQSSPGLQYAPEAKCRQCHTWALHQVTVTQNQREAEDWLAAGCCLPGMSSVMFIAGMPTLHGKSRARAAFNIQLWTAESSDTSDQSVPSLPATTSLLMGGATQKGTFNCKCSEEITGIVKSLPWLAQVLKIMHRACPCKVEKAAEAKQSGTGLLARAQLSSKSACREQASCACHNRSKTQNKAKQKKKKFPY